MSFCAKPKTRCAATAATFHTSQCYNNSFKPHHLMNRLSVRLHEVNAFLHLLNLKCLHDDPCLALRDDCLYRLPGISITVTRHLKPQPVSTNNPCT